MVKNSAESVMSSQNHVNKEAIQMPGLQMPKLLNRERLEQGMRDKGIEVLIAGSKENVQYISDCILPGYVVLPLDSGIDPFAVTWVAYVDKVVESETWITDIRYCGTFFFEHFDDGELTELEKRMYEEISPIQHKIEEWWRLQKGGAEGVPGLVDNLVEGIRDRGLERAKIGIEEKGVSLSVYQALKRELPKAEFVLADDALDYARMVKTTYEIDLFREGTPIVEKGIEDVCKIAKEGATEQDLFDAYKKSVVAEGAGIDYNTIFAFGHRSVMPTSGMGLVRPSVRLRRGDMIRFNPAIYYKNHPFHMGRTAVLGEPRYKKLEVYYQAILKGEEAQLSALRPGVKASQLYAICEQTVRASGIPHYRRHHVGHALGVGPGYDKPILSFNDDTPLEAGMILNLEPNYFELGLGGLQLEDTVLITDTGYELLTRSSRDIWRI